MPDADAAAEPAGATEAAGGARGAAPGGRRTDFLAASPNYLDLSQLSEDFAPLSSRGPKQGRKRRRQVTAHLAPCVLLCSPCSLTMDAVL
jgi:hypothetical protein